MQSVIIFRVLGYQSQVLEFVVVPYAKESSDPGEKGKNFKGA